VAQQLCRQGEEVASLLLLDAFNYQGPRRLSRGERWRKRITRTWQRAAQGGLRHKIQYAAERTWANVKAHLLLRLAPTLTTNKKVTTSLQRDSFAAKQVEILLSYRPQIYNGPITLFLCEELGEGVYFEHDPLYGWGGVALGGLHVTHIPGDHITIFEEPHVQMLARSVALSLDGKP